ncbi:unnamed protein product [Nezara viridula]|uniref:Uncharacterized protein n=1 Tax=Nezara viridula TaxID=85310 RepID=A0A9P0E3J8_NEZVI|nr:unnamed protein product [Nezara viridula]
MVLAACSSYFQCLFTELPCRHPVVVLKDVRYSEMKAILEYMYRGEVNVAQDQLAALLKVAEALKVKGLVEENGNSQQKRTEEEGNAITTSTTLLPNASSSVNTEESPPHSTGVYPAGFSKSPYAYGKTGGERSSSRMSGGSWPMTGFSVSNQSVPSTHTGATLNRCYDVVTADMPPLRRKKLSSLLMSRDTPILRTVLGQGQADSSQPVPLVCRPDSHEQGNISPFTNGSVADIEKNIKPDPSLGDAPSPYTDISTAEEDNSERQSRTNLHSSVPHSMYGETKGGVSSAIATYIPTPKPEWKRYKQYTRNDIMSAIEAVRNGMSALQAARKFGVPSRTLYDKVKKLGITTSRPFRRSSSSNGSAAFPYGLTSTGSMVYGGVEDETKYSPSIMDHGFLQHALEAHNIKREDIEREAMVAMVAATNTENNSRSSSSPRTSEHPLSPNLIKYAHRRSPTPEQIEEDSNQVEDLSITRKPEAASASRVIMPPMSQATAMVTTGNDPQDSTD